MNCPEAVSRVSGTFGVKFNEMCLLALSILALHLSVDRPHQQSHDGGTCILAQDGDP